MFKCRVCTEKDARIADLQKQLKLLTAVAFPHTLSNTEAFIQTMEANKILGGDTSDQIEIPISSIDQNTSFNNWS